MYETGKKVFKNTLYNNLSIFIGALVGFFLTVYIARVLTPTEFGYYQLSFAIVSFIGTFTILGLHVATTRYISYAIKKKDTALAKSYFKYFLKVKLLLLISSVTFIVLFANILAGYVFHKPISLYLQILAIYLFFVSFNGFLLCVINSFQDFTPNLIQKIIYESIRATLIITLLYIGLRVIGVVISLAVAPIFAFIYIVYYLNKKYKLLLQGETKQFDKKRIYRFIIEASAITIGSSIFLKVDSLLIGSLLPAKDLAYYTAALTIIYSLIMVTNFSQVLLPTVTQMKEKYLQSSVDKLVKYTSIFSLFFIVLLILFAHQIIYVIYSPKYFSSTVVLQILSLLLFTNVFGFVGVLYVSKEKLGFPAKALYGTLLLNFILTYTGVETMGIVGAAIAVVISRYVYLGLLINRSKKVLGITINYKYILKPVLASILTGSIAILYPKPTTLFNGTILLLILSVFYFGFLYLIDGYNIEDIKYIFEITGLKMFLKK